MNIARTITDAFGGPRRLAVALGHRHPTTVYHWVKIKAVPVEHWAAIEKAARRQGIAWLTAEWIGLQTGVQASAGEAA